MQLSSPHSFHIPVMGIAYTIDSPIKIACFGINSVVSIIEDNLIEVMRKYHYQQNNETYVAIGVKEPDFRSRRITDYLNMMQRTVQLKMDKLKASAFETSSDIAKYFEMLPEFSELKERFYEWLSLPNSEEKERIENSLREQMIPGSIDVNIMTKVDKEVFDENGQLTGNPSDALTALKGYAESELTNSSIILSAGMNPRLYGYMKEFSQFDAYGWGKFHKKVVIKVSDYRSALIQGKYLAKMGIWVSEFRIESGLNCGGHVFATQGLLTGPILQEFKDKKEELQQSLFELYNPAVQSKNLEVYSEPHPIKITFQGGIGTHEEDFILREFYDVDGTGWGSPFLLCPEVTNVDEDTLNLLCSAKEKDVIRSKSSPLGVGFNYLKGTSGEKERLGRIEKGRPGSPCTEKYLVSNTEFTKTPICTASRKYQKLKLEQIERLDLSKTEYQRQREDVLAKECLCVGLSNPAPIKYDVPFLKNLKAVTVCPGPNIVNFSKVVTLKEMTDHIYGRRSLINSSNRPYMFIAEIKLYIDYIKDEISKTSSPTSRNFKNWARFCENLLEGIKHYYQLSLQYDLLNSKQFIRDLENVKKQVLELSESSLQTLS